MPIRFTTQRAIGPCFTVTVLALLAVLLFLPSKAGAKAFVPQWMLAPIAYHDDTIGLIAAPRGPLANSATPQVSIPKRVQPGRRMRVIVSGFPSGARIRFQFGRYFNPPANCCASKPFPAVGKPGIPVNESGQLTTGIRMPRRYAKCVSSTCADPQWRRYRPGQRVYLGVIGDNDTGYASDLARVRRFGAATKRPPRLADGSKFAIRPKTVSGWTGSGTQVLGGKSNNPPTGHSPNGSFGRINWKRWSRGRARGRGVLWTNDCRPSCGNGTWRGEGPYLVSAFRVRQGHFTRLRLTCICGGRHSSRLFGFRDLTPPQWRTLAP